ncbi:MAG TPA: hypothetical protein VGD50_05890 [Candidatus Baltobacteraceae bacterium]
MKRSNRLLVAAVAAALGFSLLAPAPTLADGAASTRNIIFGGAAAAAGTLILINHNKQVHERYAADAQTQATLAAQRNDATAAYESERSAYNHEVAINGEYKREVSLQHQQVVSLERQLATSRRTAAAGVGNGFAQPVSGSGKTAVASLGWGQL